MILPCTSSSVDKIKEYAKKEPVIIPTDTLYGLSMSIYGDVSEIYRLKRRNLEKKIPVGVSTLEMMKTLAVIDERAEKLVERFMPGPLTIVVPSKVPDWSESIALRIPAHTIPLLLIEKIGPITLTSANISGGKPPKTIEDTMKLEVKYRIDCGELPGKQSTIVSLVGKKIKLIRSGAIPFSVILKILEE